MTEIESLLNRISSLSLQYNKISEITGENFNLFKILGLTANEVRTHSAFIAELLNPRGSHGQKDTFLKLFCDMLNIETFNSNNASMEVEKRIGYMNADLSEGGNIDIIITDSNNCSIIIENKIYAGDQTNQLLRYSNYGNKNRNSFRLIYLTLDGREPDERSTQGAKNIEYSKISYRSDVIRWLELCKKESVNHPIIRETITQYIYLIKHLTGQTMNDDLKKELVITLTSNPEHIKSAEAIAHAWEACKFKIISDLKISIKDTAEKLGLLYKIDEQKSGLGDAATGFWFYREEWCFCIYFYFENKFETLIVGVDHQSNDSKCNEAVSSKLKDFLSTFDIGGKKNYSNWIWVSQFKKWDSTRWHDVLSDIPVAIKETTEIILKKLDDFKN